MFIQPVFNQDSNRPFRWALQLTKSGNILNKYWVPQENYVHWCETPTPTIRNVFSSTSSLSVGNFIPMRRKQIGFLTTHHKDFYEDGKYTQVYNDPINYILLDSADYSTAFTDAEQRIGNYRMGVRRHITHLGGTISEDELDLLKDDAGVDLTIFPLFPPLPPVSYTEPFRSKLITSDVGYIDYIKAAHSAKTTTSRFAHRSEQGTGFRRWIYDAGNSNMKFKSEQKFSTSKVDIKDMEDIIDTALGTAIGGSTLTKQFLPDDGEDILINFPGQNIIRSNKDGIHLEIYDNTTLTTLVSLIDIDTTTGEILIGAGTSDITIVKDGTITIDTSASNSNIILNTGSGDLVLTAGKLDITGDLSVSGKLDVEGAADIKGITKHGI